MRTEPRIVQLVSPAPQRRAQHYLGHESANRGEPAHYDHTRPWHSSCRRCLLGAPLFGRKSQRLPGEDYCLTCDYELLLGDGGCVAITQSGARCRMSADAFGFCHRHDRDWLRQQWVDDLLDDTVMTASEARAIRDAERRVAGDAVARWQRHVDELIAAASDDLGQHPVVYFLEAGHYVKVGTAIDVESRVRSLRSPGDQTKRPPAVDNTRAQLIGTIPGGRRTESAVHRQMRRWRFPGTEWFVLDEACREHVTALLSSAQPRAS